MPQPFAADSVGLVTAQTLHFDTPLELACGRIFFLATYLLTGLAASGMFGLVYSDSTVPLVGASGAVSGIMAAYVVMFGMRKVKVFYSPPPAELYCDYSLYLLHLFQVIARRK